jgi:alkylation response protein AidB-like acyl-CoA dehydrogenase
MFELDETLSAVEAAVRGFCAREVEPHIAAIESGDVRGFDVLRRFAEGFGLGEALGAPMRARASRLRTGGSARAVPSPEAVDGRGSANPGIAAVVAKELARSSPGLALCLLSNLGAAATIGARGDADLIERCALPLVTLEKIGCWALTEPGSGSDAFAMKTSARLDGETIVLNGNKTFISNAPAADVLLIYARLEDPGGDKADKQRIFPVVVERGTAGLSTGAPMRKLGMHATPTGEVFLQDCRVPRSHLLGDPARPARELAEQTLVAERVMVVAMCLGVIERCLDDALGFAIARRQFGKPIAAFQLIQQKLARMYVARENVRNLMLKGIWLQRAGKGSEREVSAAKWYATEAAADAALEAMQLMGGSGYMQEYAPERLFRDIKLWTIAAGSSEIQTLTIAKDLLRERGFSIDLAGGYRADGE